MQQNMDNNITYSELPELNFDRADLQEYREETLAADVLAAGKIFRAERHKVRVPGGGEAVRELVYHAGGAAVTAVDDEGYTWLVVQYRKALEEFLWEIPAGKLDPGEDPRATAVRELREETGLEAGSLESIGVITPTPGYCSEQIHLYYASDLTAGESKPDPGEHLMQIRLPLEKALQAVKDGRITDAKTCYSLLYVWNLRNGN